MPLISFQKGGDFMQINKIVDLYKVDISSLVEESKEEGFHFLERLVNEYKNGTNDFKKTSEALYGVFTDKGILVGIGGLNVDPYTTDEKVGRVRRFYISKNCRRKGIGQNLLNKIVNEAKKKFDILVLHTDTQQASQFYKSFGFVKESNYPKTTHFMKMNEEGVWTI
jgi:N-acetylglutamate synthase-like GNAT family acetyltransferase